MIIKLLLQSRCQTIMLHILQLSKVLQAGKNNFIINIFQDVILNQETYMLEIMVENISNGTKVKMDLATSSIISKFPLVPDLWEAKMVEVCRSGIGEHAGQGTVIQNQYSDSEI